MIPSWPSATLKSILGDHQFEARAMGEMRHRRWPNGWRTVTDLATGMVDLLFPPVCPACGQGVFQDGLCETCREQFLRAATAPVCQRCAASTGPFVDTSQGCSICQPESFAFDQVVRLGRYAGPLARACLAIKDLSGLPLARALAELLWEVHNSTLQQWSIDAIVPMPLHWLRARQRGFNQAETIARVLAQHLQVPIRRYWIRRIRATKPQSRLSPSARRQNMTGVFAPCHFVWQPPVPKANRFWPTWWSASPIAAGQPTALLVDDILTTGASAHRAAQILKKMGVAQVRVAVLARGEGH